MLCKSTCRDGAFRIVPSSAAAPDGLSIGRFQNSMLIMKGESEESSAGRASYVCNAVIGCECNVASKAVIVTAEESSISSVSNCVREERLVQTADEDICSI